MFQCYTDSSSFPQVVISTPLKTKYESLLGVWGGMFWASFHTLLSLKVKLLKRSPNYARNTQAHELVCKNILIALVYTAVCSSKLSLNSKARFCSFNYENTHLSSQLTIRDEPVKNLHIHTLSF